MPTINKLFGLADPQYDALRVLSTQALQAGAGDGSTSSGGGLENKIYLWPADGSTISVYDPTQAGLIAALAAAISGDTVILPSISIALTTAVTIPTGVTLRGLSDNSELSFSGFSGAAVILGIDSVALGFSVTFAATGTEAIGLDATESGSKIIHVDATVSGGASKNVRYRLGSTASPSSTTIRYTFPYRKNSDNKTYIREAVSGNETEISSADANSMDQATVRGAWAGADVYCVDCDGVLRVSADGLTYSTLATWAPGGAHQDAGWVENTKLDGSGNLIWFRKICTLSSVVARLYEAGTGTALSDLTGDLWAVIGNPISGNTFGNFVIVYGTSTMQEMWSVTKTTPKIIWAEYDSSYSSFVVPAIAWNTITMPSGFTFASSSESFANCLQTDHLGHYLYVSGSDANNGGRASLWQLDNLAAIRAAPATAPSWSIIAYEGQVVSAGTLGHETLTTSFYIRCFGDSLYFRAKNDGGGATILGLYNGSSWVWSSGVGNNNNFQAVNYSVYADVSLTAGASQLRNWDTGAVIGSTFVSKFGIDHFSEIWRRLDAEPGEYPLLADVRSGSVSGGGAADVEVINDGTIYYSQIPILHVTDSSTAHVEGNYYDTINLDGSGSIESLAGDRSAWDTVDYPTRHAADIQNAAFTYHIDPAHPPLLNYLGNGSIFVGSAGNQAIGVTMSGDATLSNAGVLTLTAGAVDETNLGFTDITTANATSALHGLLPKLSGVPGQYLGGDGAWYDLPTVVSLFLDKTASDIGGYLSLITTVPPDAVQTIVTTVTGAATIIKNFALAANQFDFISTQVLHAHLHLAKTAGTKTANVYVEVYHRTSGGTLTLLGTSEVTTNLTASNAPYDLDVSVGDTIFSATDRFVLRILGNQGGAGTDPQVTLYYEGDTTSRVEVGAQISGGGGLSPTLSAGSFFVGNVSNVATEVNMHGDATIDDTGLITVTGTGGGVTRSGATTDGHLAVWNGSSANSIKDGGAVPSPGSTNDFLVVQVFS